jgi:hypothetical protein
MDNSKENIRQLLEKYWNSESSLEEEKTLATYFNQPEVDQEFEAYKPLFNYFDEQRQLTIDLEDQIMSRISGSKEKEKGKIIGMPWRRAISIAASLILILSVAIGVSQYRSQAKRDMGLVDTFQTPEEALEQTKAALLFLSQRMNKASDQAAKSLSKTQSLNILN